MILKGLEKYNAVRKLRREIQAHHDYYSMCCSRNDRALNARCIKDREDARRAIEYGDEVELRGGEYRAKQEAQEPGSEW